MPALFEKPRIAPAPAPADPASDPAIAFLRRLGQALTKSTWRNIETLEDGRVRLTIEYPSLGAMFDTLNQVRALLAMVDWDRLAASQAEDDD